MGKTLPCSEGRKRTVKTGGAVARQRCVCQGITAWPHRVDSFVVPAGRTGFCGSASVYEQAWGHLFYEKSVCIEA